MVLVFWQNVDNQRMWPIITVCLQIVGFSTYIWWRSSLWQMRGKEHCRYLITAVYMSVCVCMCVFETAQQVLEEVEMSKAYAVKKINPHFADFYLAPHRWLTLVDVYIYTSSIIIYQSPQSCLFFTHMKNTFLDLINRLKTASKPKGLFFVSLQMHWTSARNTHDT